jgi:hypothetical protein
MAPPVHCPLWVKSRHSSQQMLNRQLAPNNSAALNIPPMTRRLKRRIDPEQSPYCMLPEHKRVRRGRARDDRCLTRASRRRSSLMLALGYSRIGGSPCRCIQGCLELPPLYSASVCPRHSPPAMSGKAAGNSSSTAGMIRSWAITTPRSETRARLVAAIARGRRWFGELIADPTASADKRGELQRAKDQHDNLAGFLRPRSRQGRNRHWGGAEPSTPAAKASVAADENAVL